ncbi:MAG TPA: DUF3604 domain-containing protein, partial [Hyphomonadaceae bacterium]|nr:DUF3604 domain-containing protein [Hyphomonadaceae bacterium]
MRARAMLLASVGLAVCLVATPSVLGQEKSTPPGSTYQSTIPAKDRRAFFGELHLHTTMSFDAWTFGTKVTPDMAYKFARGETVMVPGVQVQQEQGMDGKSDVPAKRAWPLDFAAVTDHSEYLGAVAQLDLPDSSFSKSRLGQQLKTGGRQAFNRAAGA